VILGTGIDIVEISRIKKAVKRWGDHFLHRVLTKEEITYARKHRFPYPHYAARFAAKEAVFKAMGNPELTWQDLSITNDKHGKPTCAYRDKKFKHTILISLSHSKKYAVASAIITSKS
jgi:holo-[acyl-carrier protein] synthase